MYSFIIVLLGLFLSSPVLAEEFSEESDENCVVDMVGEMDDNILPEDRYRFTGRLLKGNKTCSTTITFTIDNKEFSGKLLETNEELMTNAVLVKVKKNYIFTAVFKSFDKNGVDNVCAYLGKIK